VDPLAYLVLLAPGPGPWGAEAQDGEGVLATHYQGDGKQLEVGEEVT